MAKLFQGYLVFEYSPPLIPPKSIGIDVMEATRLEEVSDRTFEHLLNTKYFHCAIIVQCNGFKMPLRVI